MKSFIQSTIVITTLFLASCSSNEKPVEKEEHHENENSVELTAEQYKTIDLQTGSIELKSLSGTIKVNGMLDVPPQNLVSISAPFGGTVKNTELLQGMKVKKGQVIAIIQNPDFIDVQQDYLDYKSQLEYLKLEYERQEELSTGNINAKKTVQKAKSEYESMRARVNGLKARLQLMNISIASIEKGKIQSTSSIISPISGYVTQVNTNIGAFVTPSDVLFKIADTEHLHAELTVFEKDVPKLKVGQKVRFTLANEDKERTATIYLIGREIGSNRTVNIHCHLDKEDNQLLPGMYLKGLVESGSAEVTAVPDKAIVEFEGEKYIFAEVKADHKNEYAFEMIAIKAGVSELGYTEITLPSGKNWQTLKIVINGTYDLLSKLKNGEEEGGHAH
ncbi:MAG: efflux transporter periplasmic adaptor subunit [Candidatus Fluviicola riflensis]|nr:MAG: efflux transporter periplasmic adaptor subunit [Candidatus Fluviicola riflensis]OGS77807.1 MAG: efflux transporter periplasmic adaptor subunit [Candidatus Fluviicola riflensis]OGS84872.1 MAG: efflux transporter periplasmic adaptor subunit [Fluviicola sp. RIFCSPHIGHO2_01_FULL_43_53]OGS89144.1 MAG: efflux transporter periplasmic adaptor subunit [Fluviicola sp. RIFCSPHIGHO2_12_FULL_43_24]